MAAANRSTQPPSVPARSIFRHVLAPVPRYLMRLERITRLLADHPVQPARFLEIGPGLGDVTAWLLARHPDAQAHLIEFSSDACTHLRQRFDATARVTLHSRDLLQDQLTQQFDLILAFEVLEHIEDDTLALQRIHAALVDDGLFLMSVPAFMHKWQKVDDWAGHVRRYERDELHGKLQQAGLTPVAMWGYGFPVTNLIYPLRQFHYRRGGAHAPLADRQQATRQSGIRRAFHAPALAPWIGALMTPFFLLQHLARHTALGDGWIVLARKTAATPH